MPTPLRFVVPALIALSPAGCDLFAPEPEPVVEEPPPPTKAKRPKQKARPKGPGGLVKPKPKACLSGPSGDDLGDEGAAASQGLSPDVVAGVMRDFVPKTLVCAPEAGGTSGTLVAEITVACTGVVSRVRVVEDGGLDPEMVRCLKDILHYVSFPAHDLPDGETFLHPLTYEF